MTATESAAVIRAALKRHGWTSRDVSVRAEYFSLGSAIDVRIKRATVPLSQVKAIAEAHEHVRRCEYSGEILGGGNCYVSVNYTEEALRAVAAPYLPAVQAAIDETEPGSSVLTPVHGTPYLIGRPDRWRVSLWRDSWLCDGSADSLAAHIGQLEAES